MNPTPLYFKSLTLFLNLIIVLSFSQNVNAQNCQGSYDTQDLLGDDYRIKEPFRCGSGMMADDMFMARSRREEKGYRDISQLPFKGNRGYCTMNGKVYFSFNVDSFAVIPQADSETLRREGNFIRDDNYIYCREKVQTNVSAESFIAIPNSPYAYDDSLVYYCSSRAGISDSNGILVVKGASPSSIQKLSEDPLDHYSYYYIKDSDHVFHQDKELLYANPSTFSIEESGYAKDDKHVYYSGELLEGALGSSFRQIDYYYAVDAKRVYYYGQAIEGLNGSKFHQLGESGIVTDGNSLCYRNSIYETGDPESFIDLGCGYSRDKNNVYHRGVIAEELDPDSFDVLEWGFTKDKNGVYCDGEIIPGANPVYFEVLGRKYSRDNKYVYYLRSQMDKCSPNKFKVNKDDCNIGFDGKHKYIRGVRITK